MLTRYLLAVLKNYQFAAKFWSALFLMKLKKPFHTLNHPLLLKNNDVTITNTNDTYPFRTLRCQTERFGRSFNVYYPKKRY
jgi:hypothetical protein